MLLCLHWLSVSLLVFLARQHLYWLGSTSSLSSTESGPLFVLLWVLSTPHSQNIITSKSNNNSSYTITMTVLFSTSGMFKAVESFAVFVCVVLHRIGNQGSQVRMGFLGSYFNVLVLSGLVRNSRFWNELQKYPVWGGCWGARVRHPLLHGHR